MPQTSTTNRKIVLAERPKGLPNTNTLRLEEDDIEQASAGEMLLRTVYLSLDPYMRGRMNADKSYAAPVPLGGILEGECLSLIHISEPTRPY